MILKNNFIPLTRNTDMYYKAVSTRGCHGSHLYQECWAR